MGRAVAAAEGVAAEAGEADAGRAATSKLGPGLLRSAMNGKANRRSLRS